MAPSGPNTKANGATRREVVIVAAIALAYGLPMLNMSGHTDHSIFRQGVVVPGVALIAKRVYSQRSGTQSGWQAEHLIARALCVEY